MYLYRILVVDDEPYITHSITNLLRYNCKWNTDVFEAYSGEEALAIASEQRIDILITDIRMGEIDGLELIRRIRNLYPNCKSIILTAYEDFSYAYSAIALEVSGYILKFETDDRLLSEVEKAIHLLNESFQKERIITTDKPFQGQNTLLVEKLLTEKNDNIERISKLCGSYTEKICYIHILLDKVAASYYQTILDSVLEYSGSQVKLFGTCIINQNMELITSVPLSVNAFVGVLELVQNRLINDTSIHTSFIITLVDPASQSFSEVYSNVLLVAGKIRENMKDFIYIMPENDKLYINTAFAIAVKLVNDHLADNITLDSISSYVGYSPGHLSKLFLDETGKVFSEYVADAKIQRIKELMLDRDITLNEIAQKTGFNDRSYFNRFVKRMTGMSPSDMRKKLSE